MKLFKKKSWVGNLKLVALFGMKNALNLHTMVWIRHSGNEGERGRKGGKSPPGTGRTFYFITIKIKNKTPLIIDMPWISWKDMLNLKNKTYPIHKGKKNLPWFGHTQYTYKITHLPVIFYGFQSFCARSYQQRKTNFSWSSFRNDFSAEVKATGHVYFKKEAGEGDGWGLFRTLIFCRLTMKRIS